MRSGRWFAWRSQRRCIDAVALALVLVGCGGDRDLGNYEIEHAADSPGTGITAPVTPLPLPEGFVRTEVGGYKLGPAITGAGVQDTGVQAGDAGCNQLVGVVRDFKAAAAPGGHPDFEVFSGKLQNAGIVASLLGADQKPVYAYTCSEPCARALTNKERFDQWYRYSEGVNRPYLVYFSLGPTAQDGVASFQSELFFPLDGAGWNDSARGEDDLPHNFEFTTELHTTFSYRGGEKFSFAGDDDLWVFINGKLAIDLGGVHATIGATADLDGLATALDIAPGHVYPLDLFHAERHTVGSHFHVDTSLAFVDCGRVPADVR